MLEDDNQHSKPDDYNPIKFIDLDAFTKEGVRREALKVLAAESAILKSAEGIRNVANAAVSLEPEMKAIAGSLAFIAKDAGNLFADVLILISKALGASAKKSSTDPSTKSPPGL